MSPISQKFSVDSALLKELGERLVTTPHVALAELVKNSYDADATEVTVKVREGDDGGPVIEVADNGSGMTLERIKSYWMRIGNTHKDEERRSERFGRALSGSKGIGRFCVRRLGTHVRVESSAEVRRGIEHNILNIDWTKFTPGKDVGAVSVKGTTNRTPTGKTGLKLIMSGHKQIEWRELEDKRSYKYLLRQFATLTANRGAKVEGYEPDPGFKIILDAPSLDYGHSVAGAIDDGSGDFAVDMRESLMDAGWALLTARIKRDGQIHCELDASLPIGKQSHDSTHRLKLLRDVELKVAIFVEEVGWNRNETLVPLGKLNDILSDWGGVQIRHKGMRVFPYGDPADDWLEIEKDRARRVGTPPKELTGFVETLKARSSNMKTSRVLLNMLSSKAYLGGVEIGAKQGGLDQKADREGFVENATFNELKHFTRFAIDWAMIWRDFAIRERERERSVKFRVELENAYGREIHVGEQSEVALRTLRNGIKQLARDRNSISDTDVANMTSASGLLEATFKSLNSDLQRFQLVASAATLTLLYHHEVKYLSEALNHFAIELHQAIGAFKGEVKKRCQEVLAAVTRSKESLDALGDLTQEMGVLDRKAKAISLDLAANAHRAVARFQRVCADYRIEVSLRIEDGLLVGPMLRGELAAVLLNVLSNALKAVIAGSASKRLIELHGYRSGRKVCLDVKDTGIGLTNEEAKAVFTPLVSDPSARLYDALEEKVDARDRELLGQGSGLGLSIVRGVLENRNGKAEFTTPSAGWTTCLHIELTSP